MWSGWDWWQSERDKMRWDARNEMPDGPRVIMILYSWLIWRVLKLAFFQKSIFPVFILASGTVRTTPSSCRHIFMRSLIWRWWAFVKKRQIKNHAKLTSYTVLWSYWSENRYPKWTLPEGCNPSILCTSRA